MPAFLRVVPVVIGVALGLCGPVGPARGQDKPAADSPKPAAPAAEPVALPKTAAGKVMQRVLETLGDPSKELGEDAFDDAFKAQVPYEKFKQITSGLHEEHGEFTLSRIVKQEGERDLVALLTTSKSHQTWEALLSVDPAGRIAGLRLRPSAAMNEPALASWDDLDIRLRDLPGSANFAAYQARITGDAEGGKPRVKLAEAHGFHTDQRLAIGSTFKLYVLGALGEAVQAGTARWDERLAINTLYKSLPSGRMQDEPAGKDFPISHYADLMISISDNTATDHLIHRLGREAVESYMSALHGAPSRNRPFLTTREMFAIKLSPDRSLLERYAMVDEQTRRDMLLPDAQGKFTRPVGMHHNPGEVAAIAPEARWADSWKTPRQIDKVEWFASAEECCRVMADLARLERLPGMDPLGHALRINPGLPVDSTKWSKVGFKGGSEPGVLNLTFLLTRDDGTLYVLSAGWNNTEAALDETPFMGLVARAIELLGK